VKKYELNLKLIHSNELNNIKIIFESEDNIDWEIKTQNAIGKDEKFESEFNLRDIFDLKDYEMEINFLNKLFEYINSNSYFDFNYEYLWNTKKLLIKFFNMIYKNENLDFQNSDSSIKKYDENEFKDLMKLIEKYQNESVEKINELDEKFI